MVENAIRVQNQQYTRKYNWHSTAIQLDAFHSNDGILGEFLQSLYSFETLHADASNCSYCWNASLYEESYERDSTYCVPLMCTRLRIAVHFVFTRLVSM